MNLQARDLRHIWHPCSQMKDYEDLPPIVIERGAGLYLYDVEGKSYLDMVSSWWCNLLGHCHPTINQRIKEQLDQLEHVIFANFSHRGAIELSERLAAILPDGLTRFNFSDNGSAAVEAALKMAFQYQYQTGQTKRTKFIRLSGGYHGETIGALSVGALDLYAKIYQPMLFDTAVIEAPDCYRCPYQQNRQTCACPCFERAEQVFERIADQTAAVIVEPLLQGAAGMRIYPALYLEKLRRLCDEYQVLLIADEIATGFGRTGKMFACQWAGISPDIMCLSKGLTGGYLPMSITVTTDSIYQAFYADYNAGKAFMHSHTYSGNPLGCAAALAVLDVMEEQSILDRANRTARYLTEQMNRRFLDHSNVGEIRSLGLIHAIELVEDKVSGQGFEASRRVGYQIFKAGLEQGLVLRPLGNVIYYNPPLTITEAEVDLALERTERAIRVLNG